jgi:hypothetical protein
MSNSLNALTPTLSRSTGRGGRLGSIINILGWAIFLGASWTWCIGMYLPVLLVRDYGIWAFVVFAVPNVFGAAAMAWVIPNAEASRELIRRHFLACEAFSIVTLAFHVFFFMSWVNAFFNTDYDWPLIAGLILVLALNAGLYRAGRQVAAVLVTIISTAVIVELFKNGAISLSLPHYPSGKIENLIPLSAVCVLGFSLCPYLDLTFHRARLATTASEGRVAFGIGFGVFFLAMILFTLLYTPLVVSPTARLYKFPAIVITALGFHFEAQISLKVVLHWRELRSRFGIQFAAILAIFAATLLGARCSSPYSSWQPYFDLAKNPGEFIYRVFMSAYGLYFPAYVWICIFRRRSLLVWAISVLIAAPMYWMGFIERQTIWLVPGVAVVLLAGLFRPKIAVETAR